MVHHLRLLTQPSNTIFDFFLTGGADHNVRLVSLDLGSNPKESVKTLKGHRNYVNSLAYQPEVGSQVSRSLVILVQFNLCQYLPD